MRPGAERSHLTPPGDHCRWSTGAAVFSSPRAGTITGLVLHVLAPGLGNSWDPTSGISHGAER